MWILWTAAALANPCPDLAASVQGAWVAFEDAELDAARAGIAEGLSALTCQPGPVDRATLLSLYQLDALAAVAKDEEQTALFATVRLVTAAPGETPPANFGTGLTDLHRTWTQRIAATTATLSVADGVEAWVDGRAISAPLSVVQGKHLVQFRQGEGWSSTWVEITADTVLTAPRAPLAQGSPAVSEISPEGAAAAPPTDTVATHEEIAPTAIPADLGVGMITPAPRRGRPLKLGLGITGGALTLAGAGAVVWSWSEEAAYVADPFDAPQYGSCMRADPCYEEQRSVAITEAWQQIVALRLTGAIVSGVGLSAGGVSLLLTDHGVGVAGRW